MEDRKSILEKFKNYRPLEDTVIPQQEETSDKEDEEDISDTSNSTDHDDEEASYRYTCLINYENTKDPLWLAKGLFSGEHGEICYIPEIQQEMISFYQKYKNKYHINFEASVNHGKTHVLAICDTHEKLENIHHSTLYLSESDGVAKDRLGKIANYLKQYSEITGKPIIFESENTTEFNLKGNTNLDPSLKAKGIESKYTGAHANHIIMDDVETLDTAPYIDSIIETYRTKTSKRKSATGRMFAVNTPYTPNGFLTMLRNEPNWITLQISLPDELLDEQILDSIVKHINDYPLKESIKDKVFFFLNRKLIFQAIEILNVAIEDEEESKKMEKFLMSCLDFSYRKRVILFGEVIEEEILPQWDWKVKTEGMDILTTYLTAPHSYQLTLALNPEKGTQGGFLTGHRENLIDIKQLEAFKKESFTKVFSYDMSSKKRAGTVITEGLIFYNKFIVLSQNVTDKSLYAVEDNILLYKDHYHIIEKNSWQETIIEYMGEKALSPEIMKNIIYHQTGKNKTDQMSGIVSMNKAFKLSEILFLKEGEGIDNLLQKLTVYNGIKTAKEQWDEVDGLWFIHYNAEGIRNQGIIRENKQSIHRPRFAHITRI